MIIIGITGTLGAGKGVAVDYLVEQKGFTHFSARGFLLELMTQRGIAITRESVTTFANELRKQFGPAYIFYHLYEQAQVLNRNAIIESLRTVAEVDALRAVPHTFLLAVDADQKVRYERLVSRNTELDHFTFEEFSKQEEREMHGTDPVTQNIAECMKRADAIINNNGTIGEFYQDLDREVARFLEEERRGVSVAPPQQA